MGNSNVQIFTSRSPEVSRSLTSGTLPNFPEVPNPLIKGSGHFGNYWDAKGQSAIFYMQVRDAPFVVKRANIYKDAAP